MAYIRGNYYIYMNEAGIHIIKEGDAISFIHGDEEVVDSAIAMRKALKDFLKGEGMTDEQIDS